METLNRTLTWMSDPLVSLYQRFASLIPNIIGALLLLAFGYLFGKLAGSVARRLLERLGVDRLAEKSGLKAFAQQWGVTRPLSSVLGTFIFAFVMLAFTISAADALGLAAAGVAITSVMLFLPKFLAAVIVLVVGLMVAGWLAELVRRVADGAGIEYAQTLSRITMGILTALVVLLSIEQLDVRTALLQEVIGIAFIAVGAALALSLGLGTRNLAGEIVAGVYMRDLLQEGDRIEWQGIQATVHEVGTIKTSFKLDDGRLLTVANSRLIPDELAISRRR